MVVISDPVDRKIDLHKRKRAVLDDLFSWRFGHGKRGIGFRSERDHVLFLLR